MKNNRYITVAVTLVLVIGVLLNILMLQSCSKKTGVDNEQTDETNEIFDTADISEQDTEPDYVETPYPSGLTVEERIAGYEIYDIGENDEYQGVDLANFIEAYTEGTTVDLPDKFAVTSSDISDFAAIVEYTESLSGSKDHAITTIYYKNVEIDLDPAHYIFFEPNNRLLYTDGVLVAGQQNRYYTGWAYLISDNSYTVVGEEQPVTTADPLDTYISYRFYGKDGELCYYSPCVTHPLYISSNQETGGLFEYLSKESDLDHLYVKHGKVVYEKGVFKLVESDSVTIRERWTDLQKEYEAAMFDDEIYEKYPTYKEYLTAKEQKLLPDDHYYYRGKYGVSY